MADVASSISAAGADDLVCDARDGLTVSPLSPTVYGFFEARVDFDPSPSSCE